VVADNISQLLHVMIQHHDKIFNMHLKTEDYLDGYHMETKKK